MRRTVALRQMAAVVTETVTVGQRRDSLTGDIDLVDAATGKENKAETEAS